MTPVKVVRRFYDVAYDIVRLCIGETPVDEFVISCGSVKAATDAVVAWYTDGDGRGIKFVDVYGDPLVAGSEQFRFYVESALLLSSLARAARDFEIAEREYRARLTKSGFITAKGKKV